jgi:hypothetical protein
MQVMQSSGLVDELGKEAFFADKQSALEALERQYDSSLVDLPTRDGRSPYRGIGAGSHLI